MKITDTMVLALLKKGLAYEGKGVEMEFETELPMSAITMDETDATMKMKMTCKVESYKITINEETNEF